MCYLQQICWRDFLILHTAKVHKEISWPINDTDDPIHFFILFENFECIEQIEHLEHIEHFEHIEHIDILNIFNQA